MATTYEAIATVTVGSGGAANIEFTSIPATYTDLALKISARSASTSGSVWHDLYLKYNGSSSNYSYRNLYGTGAGTGSANGTTSLSTYVVDSSATSSTFGNAEIYIPNYTTSNYKSASSDGVVENNATGALDIFSANLWSNTSAITSIALTLGTGNFAQYSTATLYGIKNS